MGKERREDKNPEPNNLSLFERMAHIVLSKADLASVPADSIGRVTFRDVGNLGHCLEISVAADKKVKEERIHHFDLVPEGFEFPVILLTDWYTWGTMEVTTPYGRLPDWVIGADNKLYSFGNIYFFNLVGQAIKFEEIICIRDENVPLEKILDDCGLVEKDVRKLDFIPDEKDSRHVQLEQNNYDKINAILQKIDSGEFVLSRPGQD